MVIALLVLIWGIILFRMITGAVKKTFPEDGAPLQTNKRNSEPRRGVVGLHAGYGAIRTSLRLNTVEEVTPITTHSNHVSVQNTFVQEPFISDIPLNIYILWDKGWDKAPLLQQMARRSWELQNPQFVVHPLNLTEAERLAERRKLLTDDYWNTLTIQSKSDVLRIAILYRRGGVWVDSTVFCNKPLISWMPSDEFVSFKRQDNLRQQKRLHITPWITSWFMASKPKSHVMRNIFRVLLNRNEHSRMKEEYFWLHRIVSENYGRDPLFRFFIDRLTLGDGPHCVNRYALESQPMFKRCNTENWQFLLDRQATGLEQ